MHSKSAQWKPAKHKKSSGGKSSKRGSTTVSKTYNLEAKRRKRYRGSFPSDYVPALDDDTFAIINTQPSKMQGED